ncbi:MULTISPECIES: hypothetical protein [unclassified Bradyrhizobium]|jgi:hypothetical protein|uniref:hypothetical protein n=1 Tax=unclassified Bradyrhizobium TaxID=2631580 RepID=UPI0012F73A84|nr:MULTISPECIES: hypothetical protein [unclassified Bradyrhizobium]MCK1332098.1 hypothetical protein [Bradyrhizobium sp. CW9]MCK1473124.1 hypothetical protein [Bradyrhizobium sp. CW10]MCK1499398.1 hypothetical protein [Bradyrhizobium sp. 188]MCK1552174.1 hypothetical protein [Bradyrhizobium sp. 177]MCK1569880.1 hypothetical protein [Bradyrhizobium sp. 173]
MAQAPASRDVRRSGGQVPSTQAWKWLTKCSGRFAQICLLIDEKLPQSGESGGEFHLLLRRYGTILLTMIKIVLIAGISFATLCQ